MEAAAHAEGELLQILHALICRQSIVGSSARLPQHYVEAYLKRHGYDVSRLSVQDDEFLLHPEYSPVSGSANPAVNVLAEPNSDGGTLLFAHIDTERVHPGWQNGLSASALSGDNCYGLGVADDKAGVALMLATVHVLAGEGFCPGILSVHGKSGGARGTLPAFTHLKRKYVGALYLHPAETGNGLREVKHASRGVLDLTIKVTGWSGNQREIGTPASARFSEGGNAADLAISLIGKLRDLLPVDCQFNLGHFEAGRESGVVPKLATAKARILFDEPHSYQSLATLAGKLMPAPHGYLVSIEPDGLTANPATLDWNAPWCRHVRRSIEAVTSETCNPYAAHLASDLRFPLRMSGLPTVGFGPIAGNFYGPDEWVSRRSMVQALAATILAVTGQSSVPPG